MTIGICRLVLFFPESGSLKSKRSLLKSICVRVRRKFNVSISEVDDNDLWQKAVVGVVIVANESRYANRVLSQVVNLVEAEGGVDLIDYSLEMI